MKKTALCIWAALCLVCISSCQESPKEWKLVWEDDFNTDAGFDTASWSKIPRGGADWNRNMSDFDSCYAVKEGNLILKGLVNYSLATDTAPYITGGIYTKDKVGFTNGRLEIRAKLQGATGAWPAIWLLPQDGQWPMGGEIDIMERLNNDSIAYQTVHSNYTYNLGIKDHPVNGGTGLINKDDYNVYSVEMHPDSLCFFINETHTFTYPRIETDKEGQFPFTTPFYLLIDMQLGGTWVGSVNKEDLPVEMKVDWVRFYQK